MLSNKTTEANKIWQVHEADHQLFLDASGKSASVISQAPETPARKAEIRESLKDETTEIFPNSQLNQPKASVKRNDDNNNKVKEEKNIAAADAYIENLIKELTESLRENNKAACFKAIINLGNEGPRAKQASSAIGNILLDSNGDKILRAKACWALSKVAPGFIEDMKNEDAKISLRAINTLSSVMYVFKNVLDRENPKETDYIRRHAIKGLDDLSLSLIPALVDLQVYENAETKDKSDILFHNIINIFIEMSQDNDKEIRKTAIMALGRIGSFGIHDTKEIITALIRKLSESNEDIKNYAIFALVKAGAFAIDEIIGASIYRTEEIREGAVIILGKMSGEKYSDKVKDKAVAALVKNIKDDRHPSVNQVAAEAIGLWGERAGNAFGALKAIFLSGKDPDVLISLGSSMGKINSKKAVYFFQDVLNKKDKENLKARRAAAWILGELGESAYIAIDDLIASLDDGDYIVCIKSAEALGKFGNYAKKALPALEKIKLKLERKNKKWFISAKEKIINEKILKAVDTAIKLIQTNGSGGRPEIRP